MHTSKHMMALGLLGAFGFLIALGAKKPVERRVSFTPPIDRQQMALVAAYVVSASDVCVRANAPDPNAIDSATLNALKDACTKAAEEQARALNWDEGEWVVEEPKADVAAVAKRPALGVPRVARKPVQNAGDEASGRARN